MFKNTLIAILSALLILPSAVFAAEINWKVTVISALPARANVPVEFCRNFSPNLYTGTLSKLQQTGVKAQNGILVKYRTLQVREENNLFFTHIDAVISKQLDPSHSWYTRVSIHLQQLTLHGIADGVWSTPDCKGRLVAQPQ